MPSLAEVLREDGIDAVRYALRDATHYTHRDYTPNPRSEAHRLGDDGEGREILSAVLREAHEG